MISQAGAAPGRLVAAGAPVRNGQVRALGVPLQHERQCGSRTCAHLPAHWIDHLAMYAEPCDTQSTLHCTWLHVGIKSPALGVTELPCMAPWG